MRLYRIAVSSILAGGAPVMRPVSPLNVTRTCSFSSTTSPPPPARALTPRRAGGGGGGGGGAGEMAKVRRAKGRRRTCPHVCVRVVRARA